ncbi:unnamed protein product [Protopolystoma xenopodis]|uniref:Uncharacterized protein n=1 Tax=Protopolystoma xenopodis TaxID=117903 RepID=A0A448X0V6_9PLAT|nr:unnamed protein product [Protopolystoma xenopodis]
MAASQQSLMEAVQQQHQQQQSQQQQQQSQQYGRLAASFSAYPGGPGTPTGVFGVAQASTSLSGSPAGINGAMTTSPAVYRTNSTYQRFSPY